MAKADNETTTGILLNEAKALVTEVYQAPHLAERLLVQWLAAGKVRWCCSFWRGRKSCGPPPGVGDPNFWEEFDPPGSGGQVVLQVNWPESRARRGGIGSYEAFRIEVVKEDVAKLLPQVAAPAPLHGFVDSGRWIVGEVKRMKAAAEIPDSITKTDFAKVLAERMRVTAKTDPSIQPIEWRSIFNRLKDWGLWPIDKIPT